MIELKQDTMDAMLREPGISIVDFWATFCGPCKILAPVLEELATKYSEIKVGKVDISSNLPLASKYKVMNVPCLIVFRDGEEVDRMVGFKGKESLENLFIKHS